MDAPPGVGLTWGESTRWVLAKMAAPCATTVSGSYEKSSLMPRPSRGSDNCSRTYGARLGPPTRIDALRRPTSGSFAATPPRARFGGCSHPTAPTAEPVGATDPRPVHRRVVPVTSGSGCCARVAVGCQGVWLGSRSVSGLFLLGGLAPRFGAPRGQHGFCRPPGARNRPAWLDRSVASPPLRCAHRPVLVTD